MSDKKYDEYIKLYNQSNQSYKPDEKYDFDNSYNLLSKLEEDIYNFIEKLREEMSLEERSLEEQGTYEITETRGDISTYNYTNIDDIEDLNVKHSEDINSFENEALSIIEELNDYENYLFKNNDDIISILKNYADLQQTYRDKYKFQ